MLGCFPYAGYWPRNAWAACRPSLLLALLTSIPYVTLMLIWRANEGSFARHFVAGAVLTIITWALAARGLKHPVWDEVTQVLRSVAVRLHKPASPAS